MIVNVKVVAAGGKVLFDEFLDVPDTGDLYSNILNALGSAESMLCFDNEWFDKYGGNKPT